MGVVIFNGVSTKDKDIIVELIPSYDIPERLYLEETIPGRNGTLLIPISNHKVYRNTQKQYSLAIISQTQSFPELCSILSEWMLAPDGYCKLEDSYEPDVYRLAYIKAPNTLNEMGYFRSATRVNITFECKPQKFLKSGLDPISFKANESGFTSESIFNPTNFDSEPIIKVICDGDGLITINDTEISITDVRGFIFINSEIKDAYNDTMNLNNKISIPVNKTFPIFKPGLNKISFKGNISLLEVIPNWWTI